MKKTMIRANSIPTLRIVAPSHEMAASGYYRIVLPLANIVTHGLAKAIWRDLIPYTDDDISHSETLSHQMAQLLTWSSVILLERETRLHLVPIIEKARSAGKLVAMDIDDHVVDFPYISNGQVADYWALHLGDFLSIVHEIDLLITTTQRLADAYKQYLRPGARAITIPNFIDCDSKRWAIQPAPPHPLTLGWMGGPTHAHDLDLLQEPLAAILRRYPQVRFKCVGLQPTWIGSLPHDQVISDTGYTHIDDYPSRMSDFDIGLIPLQRTPFNDIGKSDIKFLEYAMLSIPSIVSATPAYATVSSRTGVKVENTPSAWTAAISRLIDNPGARATIGAAAKRYAVHSRNISFNCYRWTDAMMSCMAA